MRKRWMRLGICALLVAGFLFVGAPMLTQLPLIEPIARTIDERGIDAGAYFYTEADSYDLYLRHALRR